jgi:hypothetical protein
MARFWKAALLAVVWLYLDLNDPVFEDISDASLWEAEMAAAVWVLLDLSVWTVVITAALSGLLDTSFWKVAIVCAVIDWFLFSSVTPPPSSSYTPFNPTFHDRPWTENDPLLPSVRIPVRLRPHPSTLLRFHQLVLFPINMGEPIGRRATLDPCIIPTLLYPIQPSTVDLGPTTTLSFLQLVLLAITLGRIGLIATLES